MKNIFILLSILLVSCLSTDKKNSRTIGGRNYPIINKATARKYMDKADAVIAWHQNSDEAIIRTKHRGVIKEGKFFIPNLASGLNKLHRGRKTIIMILDEELINSSGTASILNSLNPRQVKVYITFFNEMKESST